MGLGLERREVACAFLHTNREMELADLPLSTDNGPGPSRKEGESASFTRPPAIQTA